MKTHLQSLLYYELSAIKHGEIQKGLKEYGLLLTALIHCIEAFEANDLEKFDSLVGENACQIRAIRIALIHCQNSFDVTIKQTAERIKEEVEALLETKIRFLSSSGMSLQGVFDQYHLGIELSEDEVFAFISYMLTEMKEVHSPGMIFSDLERKEKCAPIKIKKFNPEVSYSFSSKLSYHLRKMLSTLSVQFVQKTAGILQDPLLAYGVSDAFLYEHNALQCLPLYWVSKVMFSAAKNKNIPIIAHVKFTRKTEHGFIVTREECFYFSPQKNLNGEIVYRQSIPSEKDLKQVACVIQGLASCNHSTWAQDFLLNESILDTVLAGTAAHRQYPTSESIPFVADEEYKELYQLADQKGFSLSNPSTFFIQHIFASQAKNYVPSA